MRAASISTDLVAGRAGHPPHPRRILAVQTQRIGDVLCLTPLLTALRRRFPSAELSALVQPPAHELLEDNPDLAETIVYDPRRDRGRLSSILALAQRLRRRQFDWAIVVHAADSVTWSIRLAGVPWRTRVWRYGTAEPPAWHRLYNQYVVQDRGRGAQHEVEYDLNLLRALGIAPQHDGVRLAISRLLKQLRWRRFAQRALLPPGD